MSEPILIDPADIADLESRIGLHGSVVKADVIDPIFAIIVATGGHGCGDGND